MRGKGVFVGRSRHFTVAVLVNDINVFSRYALLSALLANLMRVR